jgi:ligand-binding SRPBCC domain-containing protein
MPTYEKRTFIAATPEAVFAFHERPDALERLTPPWEKARVVERTGDGLNVGARVTVELRLGPFRLRWVAEHVAYDPPRMFRDVQRGGPFRSWDHTHTVEPAPGGATLVDAISYELPFAPFSMVAAPFVRRKVERLFDFRHDLTKRVCEGRS